MASTNKSLARARVRRWLAKTMPLRWKVRVVCHDKHPGYHGYFEANGRRATIYLRASDSAAVQCETLLEEWSHGLRMMLPIPHERGDEHDAIWRAIYGTVVVAYREKFCGGANEPEEQ